LRCSSHPFLYSVSMANLMSIKIWQIIVASLPSLFSELWGVDPLVFCKDPQNWTRLWLQHWIILIWNLTLLPILLTALSGLNGRLQLMRQVVICYYLERGYVGDCISESTSNWMLVILNLKDRTSGTPVCKIYVLNFFLHFLA